MFNPNEIVSVEERVFYLTHIIKFLPERVSKFSNLFLKHTCFMKSCFQDTPLILKSCHNIEKAKFGKFVPKGQGAWIRLKAPQIIMLECTGFPLLFRYQFNSI